ncbi:hypothetical protein P256_00296 [Acinetobacter nectaris CIP 110549]|uniref:Uncharacterized protein n=1 Tax=Acinetobacter nectaris CIP 110549 TaxID=1392540 RepID=V2TU65_9GAMM|nr:hypothetical protein [Acinetobacter nectaris]ESK41306.1 hypothetical protein P256_00296 [Acinetobacter nectaris CIP 110549]
MVFSKYIKFTSSILLTLSVTNHLHASTFKTYTDDSNSFRSVLNENDVNQLPEKLKDKDSGKDAVLYILERARIYQVNQQYQESLDTYKKAFELLEKQNNRAKFSVTRVGFKALSMMSNDSVVPYLVPPYEQVLAHISQAKNYIFLKDIENAGVEMRIAQQIQREIELDHEKELARKEEKLKSKMSSNSPKSEDDEVEDAKAPSELNDALSGLDTIAGKIKNTYQNSYAFYMAANVWEALGEYNDALVDYKKAYELQPDEQIAQDIKRVDQLNLQKTSATTPVVIFIEQGLVPQKIEHKLTIPVPNGLINIAYATYEPKTYQTPQTINILLNNRKVQNSYVMSDIGALAVKQLKEHTLSTVSSQVARATTKYIAQQQLGQQLGTLGQIAGNLLNASTEHADLRSWSTLPSNTQVARLNLAPGTYNLQLDRFNSSASIPLTVQAGMNQPIFVYAYDVNNKISISSSNLVKP